MYFTNIHIIRVIFMYVYTYYMYIHYMSIFNKEYGSFGPPLLYVLFPDRLQGEIFERSIMTSLTKPRPLITRTQSSVNESIRTLFIHSLTSLTI